MSRSKIEGRKLHHTLTMWVEDVWTDDVWAEVVWTEDVTIFTCPTVSFTSLPSSMTLKSTTYDNIFLFVSRCEDLHTIRI